MSHYRFKPLSALSLFAATASLVSCSGIPLPKSDPSPPVITWSVLKGSQSLPPGQDTPAVKWTDAVTVVCVAEDKQGGIHRLKVEGKFYGKVRAVKHDEHFKYNVYPNGTAWVKTFEQVLTPKNNSVLPKWAAHVDATPMNLTTKVGGEDCHAYNGYITLTATAENHVGGQTTSTLQIKVDS